MNVGDFDCLTCLDFRVLPGVGPCPDCRPDEYADFVLAILAALDAGAARGSAGGEAA